MAIIKPFKAMRFTKKAGEIHELVCPPYDIISENQRLGYLQRNEHNIIRLELPKEGANPYETAGTTLNDWLKDEILAKDSNAALYIYEEEFSALGKTRKVKGFTCRVKLEEFSAGVVLPHEETLSKAKADRFDLMCATGSNFSSIYSLYFDEEGSVYGAIDSVSNGNLPQGKADIEFKAEDGIIQRLWAVTDAAAVEKICKLMQDKKLYIADGHHRYETALNYRKHLIESGEDVGEDHAANYIMMTLVNMEHEGLVVFPTHRIVRGLDNFSAEKMLGDCEKYFNIESCDKDKLEAAIEAHAKGGRKAVGFYGGGAARLLVLKDFGTMQELLPQRSEAYQRLDVSILHTLILERLMGIDKENMANQKNLIYTRDVAEAMNAADSGEADCVFIIGATRVDEIAAVAGHNEKMPQKSTYFYPKLITGLVMNRLD